MFDLVPLNDDWPVIRSEQGASIGVATVPAACRCDHGSYALTARVKFVSTPDAGAVIACNDHGFSPDSRTPCEGMSQ